MILITKEKTEFIGRMAVASKITDAGSAHSKTSAIEVFRTKTIFFLYDQKTGSLLDVGSETDVKEALTLVKEDYLELGLQPQRLMIAVSQAISQSQLNLVTSGDGHRRCVHSLRCLWPPRHAGYHG